MRARTQPLLSPHCAPHVLGIFRELRILPFRYGLVGTTDLQFRDGTEVATVRVVVAPLVHVECRVCELSEAAIAQRVHTDSLSVRRFALHRFVACRVARRARSHVSLQFYHLRPIANRGGAGAAVCATLHSGLALPVVCIFAYLLLTYK